MLLLVLALGSLCAFGVPLRAALAQDDAGTVLAQINGLRASKGLPPLSVNGALAAAATAHSTYLANNRWSDPHVESNGSTPHSRIVAAGYGNGYVGENVYGGGMATAAIAYNYWLNSPVHYTGMTNPGFSEIGIGVVRGPFGTFYTTDFGGGGGGGAPVAAAPPADTPANPPSGAAVVNSGPPAPTKTRARPLPSAIPTNTPGPSAPPTLTFTPVPSKTHAPDEPDAPTPTAFIFDLEPQADTPLAVAALPTATTSPQVVNTELPTATATLQVITVLPSPMARVDILPEHTADDTQNGFASAIIPVALVLQGVVLGGFLLRRRR